METPLHDMVEDFVKKWGVAFPRPLLRQSFVNDLRKLLEVYGKAAIEHGSLPDTEHEHGDPI